MLRAARFVATLGFEPDPELVAAIEQMRERLQIISAERIRDELSKLLLADDPSAGLWLISRTGLADEFLPELNSMELEQDPIHRTKTCSRTRSRSSRRRHRGLKLRLAALLHDVGKPGTRGYGPQGVTFHYHDVVGARMARQRLLALRYPNDVVDDVAKLVELHLRFHTYRMGWTDSAVRRYVRDAGPLLDDLNELTRCDCTTRNAKKAAALAPADGSARGAHRRAARAGGAGEAPARARRRRDDAACSACRRAGSSARPRTSCMEIRLEEGEISEEEATRTSARLGARTGADRGLERLPCGRAR